MNKETRQSIKQLQEELDGLRDTVINNGRWILARVDLIMHYLNVEIHRKPAKMMLVKEKKK